MNRLKNIYWNKIILTVMLISSMLICTPLTVNAGYDGKGTVTEEVTGDIDITLEGIEFDDHPGMQAEINKEPAFCVQRGKPFRSTVSELQMVTISGTDGFGNSYSGTIANNMREILNDVSATLDWEYFRGWGTWILNGDHTDATQKDTTGAPSSNAKKEVFDENTIDDEDDHYNDRYQGSDTPIRKWLSEVMPLLTGHEGCVETFAPQMQEISLEKSGYGPSQWYAFGLIHYYIYEDPDAASYSDDAKYLCEQAMDWAVQYGFIDTIGNRGNNITLWYQDKEGQWDDGASQTYTGDCDGYIRTAIEKQYEPMKLYRQVVWKTTNMRVTPSFAEKDPNDCEPITLYWDEDQQSYTATVSDANGVLKYFDFEIPGVTCTENEDGTLTISSANALSGELTSNGAVSKIEPADGIFKLPTFYRWELEGKTVTFKYTALIQDTKQDAPDLHYVENGSGKKTEQGTIYKHSHTYDPACNWFCENTSLLTHCTWDSSNDANNCSHSCNNDCASDNSNCSHTCGTDCANGCIHSHDDNCKKYWCGHTHTKDACHSHTDDCRHKSTCPNEIGRGSNAYYNCEPSEAEGDACSVIWCCSKQHFKTTEKEISGKFVDWQDLIGSYATGQKLVDPTYCYIKVVTEPHEFPAETDTEILLIADKAEWNDLTYTMPDGSTVKHASHIRVGEKYKLRYIYTYKGASKGFRIEFSTPNKKYYQYNYLARMQEPQNTTPIYAMRDGSTFKSSLSFATGSVTVPHAVLVQDKTPITIKGIYTTSETAYTLNGTYTFNSNDDWNDSIYLDALTTDQYDDNYNNKAADNYSGANGGEKITTSNTSSARKSFQVTKENDTIQVVWVYETEPEVFTSAYVNARAFIRVEDNENYTKTYYDEAYNYAKDKQGATTHTNWSWNKDLKEHNNVGGVGYFSSEYTDANGTQSNTLIPSHTVYTQNNEYMTYALKNKFWQSDIDIKVSNFVQNTGAGITEHTYYERANATHPVNYNLYYTIEVTNPKATIYENKVREHDKLQAEEIENTTTYNTTSDVNEFDLNTLISWGASGSTINKDGAEGSVVVVDHVKTGITYLQREIPTVLNTLSTNKAVMTMKIYPNHDRLIYEDHYRGVTKKDSGQYRNLEFTLSDSYYPTNEQKATSDIYAAMNPNNKAMQPQNIVGSDNVPNTRNDEAITYSNAKTSFSIKLSNGNVKTVVDSHTKTYKQYDFTFNKNALNNKVKFTSPRTSITFFKYSLSNYEYNGKVENATGVFATNNKTQTESYYISQVLFKSNYTTKYQKELEKQGANYVVEEKSNGQKEVWIDMVNQNKYAIVSAGQGFELKVTVKYENSFLTQYLARYFCDNSAHNINCSDDGDDAQHNSIGTSRTLGPQYCNISAMTGRVTDDGKTHAYINGINTIDRLAVNLVTGSNVYKDLYAFMSDNPDTVYSYSGIYDTPVAFDRQISYSKDYSVTTITYTMCKSTENGVSSSFQNMKFYTDQLAPDKKSPGIVEGSYDVTAKGEHSITLWTPVVAATPFDYPSTIQDRYIGDAIELGYTIKTTGADDSIVHIVQ